MAKYKFFFDVGYRKMRAYGSLDFPDDAAAIAVFTALDTDGVCAELWRPDSKRLLARKNAEGVTTLADGEIVPLFDQAKP